jgi:hypothetical protein
MRSPSIRLISIGWLLAVCPGHALVPRREERLVRFDSQVALRGIGSYGKHVATYQGSSWRDAPLFFGGGLRNPEAFIAFTPGVNNGSGDSSINGGNRGRREVLVDGAGMTIPESGGVVFNFPAVEQFGEFRIPDQQLQRGVRPDRWGD